MATPAIGRLPAGAQLLLYPGDPLHVEVTVVDGDGPVDITGWAFESTIGDVALTVAIVDAAAGRFDLLLADTEDLDGRHVWRLVRTGPGDPTTWVHGIALADRKAGSPTSTVDIRVEDGTDELVLQVLEGRPGTGMVLDGWAVSIDEDGTLVTEEIG